MPVECTAAEVVVDDCSVLDEAVWVSVPVAYSVDDALTVMLEFRGVVITTGAIVDVVEEGDFERGVVSTLPAKASSGLVRFTAVVVCSAVNVSAVAGVVANGAVVVEVPEVVVKEEV